MSQLAGHESISQLNNKMRMLQQYAAKPAQVSLMMVCNCRHGMQTPARNVLILDKVDLSGRRFEFLGCLSNLHACPLLSRACSDKFATQSVAHW